MRTSIEIGHELLTQARYSEARPILERAVSEYPNEGRAHLYLAIALAQLGENALAEKHFAHAIALSPNDGYVFYNWGAYLHRQGRLEEALRAYETAVRLNPTLVGAHQMAKALRESLGQPPPPTPVSASTPTGMLPPSTPSTLPPLNPDDLRMPTPGRWQRARLWVVLGLIISAMGLCMPPVGLIGGVLCALIAAGRGSFAGGCVVLLSAIVLSAIGFIVQAILKAISSGQIPA